MRRLLSAPRRENLAWISRLARPGSLRACPGPLRTKGGGACAKHVLNTRLAAGRLARRGDHARRRRKASNLFPTPCGRLRLVRPSSVPDQRKPDRCGLAPGCSSTAERARLEQLYRQEARGLARTILRRTGDPELACDLIQDTFLRVAGRAAALPVLDRPQAYLKRIAANLLKDRRQSEMRRSAPLHVVADEHILPAIDPHAQLESRDMLRRVEAAMLRLPTKTREIFMAHRVEGLSYAEIAERSGMTVKGVEKQMSKALVSLDRLMARR